MKGTLPATLATLALGFLVAAQDSEGNTPWTLVAWNDLGMHCMDSDYSVFSILPPYNTVWAQLVDPSGELVTAAGDITVTYEAVADPQGSINTSSFGKTNYWFFAPQLYGGSSTPDTGLAGHDMPGPGNTPQPMSFSAEHEAWIAEGIPLTPTDDAGHGRTYPLMRIVARNAQGDLLAATTPVLPVSDEMDCSACHASGSDDAAEPAAGWVLDSSWERDYRLNILRLHDEQHLGDAVYDDALIQAGHDPAGLFATVATLGRPILCASCHGSNALPGTGIEGISALTAAVHAGHAEVEDPLTGMILDDADNRSSCYRCHPGSETGCLRGAMGGAVASDGQLSMQCQSCHGNMSTVGDAGRVGWLEEPTCQNCHTGNALVNNGQIRYENAFDTNGELRIAADATFATNADVPAAGFSLYRFSAGHGGLQCSACHGSTHAVFPATHPNDNLASVANQGHIGTLVECSTCHAGELETGDGGPHGMHPVGDPWIDDHKKYAENGGYFDCRVCHGPDDSGTVLSLMQADRTLDLEHGDTIDLWRGSRVGCYTCHQGPTDSDETQNHRPQVADDSIAVASSPVDVSLLATDADGDTLELRIVQQPAFGRVGLDGNLATYHPNPGFAGVDSFTFAAWDGAIDSNLGTVSVERLAGWNNYGLGFPGTNGVVPDLTASDVPTLGTEIQVQAGNSSGTPTTLIGIASTEKTTLVTEFGGLLLVEPKIVQVTGLGAAGSDYPLTLPTEPGLAGLTVHFQTLQVDPGAPFLLAFSRGLALVMGQ